MTLLRRLGFIATIVISIATVLPARAATVTGIAVSAVGSTTPGVGLTENRPLLGGNAIEYFVPLRDTSGTYGGVGSTCSAGFGTCADTGNGGGTLSMVLRFSPIMSTVPSYLTVKFEDLDLKGVNDPNGFFESLNVFRNGSSITGGWITNISSLLVDGNHDTQVLKLLLNAPINDPLYLVLNFKAKADFYGTNTPEYLRATIDVGDQTPPIPTPLPGTLLLMGSLLSCAYGASAWRRRRQPIA
jgi:hypothetical protein